MWRPNPRGERPLSARDVDRECEAFLTGTLVDYLAERGRPVPSWAWLAVLAHSDEERLVSLASEERVKVPADLRAWWDVVAFLAGEVLDTARGLTWPCERLQRTRLVPLELELAAYNSVGEEGMPREPGAFANVVLAALEPDADSSA